MEVVVEVDAGLGIDNGGTSIVDKVLGDDGNVGVSQNSFHVTLGGFLEGGLDLEPDLGEGDVEGDLGGEGDEDGDLGDEGDEDGDLVDEGDEDGDLVGGGVERKLYERD